MRNRKKDNSGFMLQGIILAAAGIITRIIGLIYRIPLNGIIGDNGYYTKAYDIYSMALVISSYSLPIAVSKLVSAKIAMGEEKNAFRIFLSALLFALVSGGIITSVLFFGADVIATSFMSSPLTAIALRTLSPALFIVAILGVVRGYFQGRGTMMPTAISQILEQIMNALISILAAIRFLEEGKKMALSEDNPLLEPAYAAAGGTLGTVLGAGIALLFMLFIFAMYARLLKQKIKRDRRSRKESYLVLFKNLFLIILPIIIATAVYNMSQTIDAAVFGKIMGAQGVPEAQTEEMLGVFGMKYLTLINIPLAIANALGASAMPSITAAFERGERRLVIGKMRSTIRFIMQIAIPSAMGFFVLSSAIMQLIFGDARPLPANMLRLGAISVVFFSLSTMTNALLQGVNKFTVPIKNALISLGVHLVILVIMLAGFKLNVYGLVIGNIIFSLSMCVLNTQSLKKAVKYRQEVKKTFVIPSIAAILMGVLSFGFYTLLDIFLNVRIAAVLSLPVAVIIYASALLKLGGLSEDEILTIPKGAFLLQLFRKLHLLPRNFQY